MRTLSKAEKGISLALKLIVILSAAAGTLMSAAAGRNSFMGGSRVLMYFTIQSNLLVAVGLGYLALAASIGKSRRRQA